MKRQAESEKLPPTRCALQQAILRASCQGMIWEDDRVAKPEIPSPEGYGWKRDDSSEWKPVMNTLPPATDACYIHLVKCGCLKTRCPTNHFQCSKAGLPCTDL